MTSNYHSARPQLHPDTQGAHPTRRDKDQAPLRQTAAGPYGGVPRRVWDYRYTQYAPHTLISLIHTVYAHSYTTYLTQVPIESHIVAENTAGNGGAQCLQCFSHQLKWHVRLLNTVGLF